MHKRLLLVIIATTLSICICACTKTPAPSPSINTSYMTTVSTHTVQSEVTSTNATTNTEPTPTTILTTQIESTQTTPSTTILTTIASISQTEASASMSTTSPMPTSPPASMNYPLKAFDVNKTSFMGEAIIPTISLQQIGSMVLVEMTVINYTNKNLVVFPITINLYNANSLRVGYISVAGPFVLPNQSAPASGFTTLVMSPSEEIVFVDCDFSVVAS